MHGWSNSMLKKASRCIKYTTFNKTNQNNKQTVWGGLAAPGFMIFKSRPYKELVSTFGKISLNAVGCRVIRRWAQDHVARAPRNLDSVWQTRARHVHMLKTLDTFL
eukprot:s2276_g9.t1